MIQNSSLFKKLPIEQVTSCPVNSFLAVWKQNLFKKIFLYYYLLNARRKPIKNQGLNIKLTKYPKAAGKVNYLNIEQSLLPAENIQGSAICLYIGNRYNWNTFISRIRFFINIMMKYLFIRTEKVISYLIKR